jgi:alanine racemase
MLSYIEISKSAVLHNLQKMKSFVKNSTQFVAVIKANAYGHGQNEIARILEGKVDYFQLNSLQELELLRKVSQKPALILGYVSQAEIERSLELDAILCVYDKDQIYFLNETAKRCERKAKVHLKVDAHLGRQGVLFDELEKVFDCFNTYPFVELDGIYSHFSNIENTSDPTHSRKQIETFSKALHIAIKRGWHTIKSHISASSGIMVYESTEGASSLVRAGLSLYGMWPSEGLKNDFETKSFSLRPILRWVSHIAQVKNLPTNYPIGYGLTYITSRPTKIAIIPQGYSDGYDRGLSNTGEVLIQGTRCPIRGRVSMNMFAADVTHLENVRPEEEVILLGSQGNEELTADEIAAHLGTINYEVTTRISPLLPRVVVQ